jgi:hypothetical protein
MSYPGGKAGDGVYQRLINLMPPHRVYIEPFLGGGAIMRLKRPAELNIGVDLVDPAQLPIVASHAQISDCRRGSSFPKSSAEVAVSGDGILAASSRQ